MNQGNEQNQHIYFIVEFSRFRCPKSLFNVYHVRIKVKMVSNWMYHECIAETQGYKSDKFHTTDFNINNGIKEEVELCE